MSRELESEEDAKFISVAGGWYTSGAAGADSVDAGAESVLSISVYESLAVEASVAAGAEAVSVVPEPSELFADSAGASSFNTASIGSPADSSLSQVQSLSLSW